jgi:hypothetical protein
MADIKITITSKPHDGLKHPWLRGRPMFNWTLEYDGQTYSDGGHPASEVHHAADSAIARYRGLFHDDQIRREQANRTRSGKPKEAA